MWDEGRKNLRALLIPEGSRNILTPVYKSKTLGPWTQQSNKSQAV